MAAAMLLGAVLFLLAFYMLSLKYNFKNQREPPGPRPLPVLGNLLQLDLKRLHISLLKLSQKYGSVFTVHLGLTKVVVLAGYKTVQQALVHHAEEFGNRDVTPIFHDFNEGHGIVFTNGETWREMRRFALRTLRDFGMGKKMAEEKITEECHHLIEEFKKHKGAAFDSTEVMHCAASNIISAIIYGTRFEYHDPLFKRLVERDNESMHLTGSAAIQVYNAFPWLGPWLKAWRKLMKNKKDSVEEVKTLVKGLEETLDPEMPRCFVDAFLTRKRSHEETGNMDSLYYNDNLVHSVMNLFSAGTETTGNTLRWGLMFMAKYPLIQDQVREELSRVIGSRQIWAEDRRNLPYTDAVIHETQRLANVAPMSLPHTTSRDVNFQGYLIKKGTTVFPLLTSVLWDETEWESPQTFNPNHFLDKERQFVKRDAFMPFSAGRRVCLGERLARMELFLFFSSLLQHFSFTPPPGVREEELDLTPTVGLSLSPSPHKLCAVIKHNK